VIFGHFSHFGRLGSFSFGQRFPDEESIPQELKDVEGYINALGLSPENQK
jgi:hypothetical protein